MKDVIVLGAAAASPIAAFLGGWLGSRRASRRPLVSDPAIELDNDLDPDTVDYIEAEAERLSASDGRPGFGRFAAGYITDVLRDERRRT